MNLIFPKLFICVFSSADLDLDEPDSVAPRLQSSFKLIHEVGKLLADCAFKLPSIARNLCDLAYFICY